MGTDSDYLWDRSGPPDPDVVELEQLLGSLRHQPESAMPLRTRKTRAVPPVLLAIAATLLLSVGAAVQMTRSRSATSVAATVATLEGTPRVAGQPVQESVRWLTGQTLQTDAHSRAAITIDNLGALEIGPSTRVVFSGVAGGVHRLRLERGRLQASIAAPAGLFVVDTPASAAVDLGCSYDLAVGEAGDTWLQVSAGLVALTSGGKDALVPAGYVCATAAAGRPCTPVWYDHRAALVQTVQRLDEGLTGSELHAAVGALVERADGDDAVTLWHVLQRVPGAERPRIYDRLTALTPPPPGVGREQALSGDRAALDRWWDSFGYGELALWRSIAPGLSLR